MNNAQIDRFINNHGEFFANLDLNENEKKVLEDRFSQICCTNQEERQENQRLSCAICISDFKEGEKFVYHPGCFHLFHFVCIEEWFREKLVCPICKDNTRRNLIESFKKGDKGDKDFWEVIEENKNIQYLITGLEIVKKV